MSTRLEFASDVIAGDHLESGMDSTGYTDVGMLARAAGISSPNTPTTACDHPETADDMLFQIPDEEIEMLPAKRSVTFDSHSGSSRYADLHQLNQSRLGGMEDGSSQWDPLEALSPSPHR
jgi:hypothetical protein